MPPLTRWFVKTSFIYLALALITGLLVDIQSTFKFTALGGLFHVYIHLFVFGWITQLIFGVVLWMFPKHSTEKPRGSESLGWWTYALLNLGLLLRAIAEPVQSTQPNPIGGWALVLSAAIQFSAGLAFVANSWGRVKEKYMPWLSVWFVRASFIYLLPGFLFGALILAQKGIPYYPPVWNLFPIHMEFLLIGWFAQLAMGVACWIVPRFRLGSPRGNVRLVWVSFALINVGVITGTLRVWFPAAILTAPSRKPAQELFSQSVCGGASNHMGCCNMVSLRMEPDPERSEAKPKERHEAIPSHDWRLLHHSPSLSLRIAPCNDGNRMTAAL